MNYKTPGVYIEEIPTFPPSVAQVETAIPAFIGNTEKAEKNGETLTDKPTKIKSLQEYHEIFGAGPPNDVDVTLDTQNQVTKVTQTKGTFLLYDSVRLFYDNGGGDCYIVSVGDYKTATTPDLADLKDGLAKVAKIDEPTILLAPDATLLSSTDGLYDFQKAAISQCVELQDRVAVLDLKKSDESVSGETFDDRVKEFRTKIGINGLKYSAAYGPWLKTTLNKVVRFRDISLNGGTIQLESLTSDNDIIQLIFDLNNAIKAGKDLEGSILTGLLDAPATTLEDTFKQLFDAFNATFSDVSKTNFTDFQTDLSNIFNKITEILAAVFTFQASLPTTVGTTPDPADSAKTKDFLLIEDIGAIITNKSLKDAFDILLHHHNAASISFSGDDPQDDATNLGQSLLLLGYAADPTALSTFDITTISDPDIVNLYSGATDDRARAQIARAALAGAYSQFISYFYAVQGAASEYESTFEKSLTNAFGFYKNLKTKIASELNLSPPSGAIAGVYARVDRERGVWKAPANVSLNSVSAPSVQISKNDQSSLNVDVNAGKSINAIRSFTGKGILVWGARTLAGNDNEWRYISVRRFFNMVEESVKKATEGFVFEPNDANTWVKVRAMIENFLSLQWRAGALAGATPEDAYYVRVGLGSTMTSVDILEGRMNVEIGMAVVRPAEFIILKFSHKMQES